MKLLQLADLKSRTELMILSVESCTDSVEFGQADSMSDMSHLLLEIIKNDPINNPLEYVRFKCPNCILPAHFSDTL